MDHDLDNLLADHDARKMMRVGAEPIWQAITEILAPDSTPPWKNIADGASTRWEIFDNTAEDAADTASAALGAMTVNAATRWMELGLFNDVIARDTMAGKYLWDASSTMLTAFRHPSTLFNLANDEDYKQLVVFGNGCLHVEQRWGKLPLYRAMPIAKIWWDEDADGVIDIVDREFDLTARASAKKFGNALPRKILDMAEARGRSLDMVRFLHINMPRDERDVGKLDRANMAYRSVYICVDDPAIVVDGGSHELEYICSRWSRRAGERWGRGCGHKALGDVEMLQRMNRSVMLAAERTVDPAILAPEDGITGSISLKARAINTVRAEYMANGAAPRAMVPNTRIDIGVELLKDRRDLVRMSFLHQLLEVMQDPRATATQILSQDEAKKRGLAPILGRLEQERLGPLVARSFNILSRMPGVMPAAPPEMRGMPLQPSFQTPDAKAMRLGVARAVAQSIEALGPMVQATGNTALWDNIDQDAAFRVQADGIGTPASVMRPVDVVARMRAHRVQIQAEQQQIENDKNRSVTVKNLTPMAAVVNDAAQYAHQAATQQTPQQPPAPQQEAA